MQDARPEDQELELHESEALAKIVEALTAKRGRIRMTRKHTKPRKPRARKTVARYKPRSLLAGAPQYK